jgi:hypothetical protein
LIFELEFSVKNFEKILQLTTFFRQKDETLKMLYRRFLKIKEDIESITDPKAAHQYCRNPTLAKCGGEAQQLEKVRIWSPPGLPNVQSSTARGKTPRTGVFLVSLERS